MPKAKPVDLEKVELAVARRMGKSAEELRREDLRRMRHTSKTGTRPVLAQELSNRMSDPGWQRRRGMHHEPVDGWSAPGRAPDRVHRAFRVLKGGYQGPRKHARRLVVAWERAALCIQCSKPILSTAYASTYKGKEGLRHAFHFDSQEHARSLARVRVARKFQATRRNLAFLRR